MKGTTKAPVVTELFQQKMYSYHNPGFTRPTFASSKRFEKTENTSSPL